jgi:hypothetical protein
MIVMVWHYIQPEMLQMGRIFLIVSLPSTECRRRFFFLAFPSFRTHPLFSRRNTFARRHEEKKKKKKKTGVNL